VDRITQTNQNDKTYMQETQSKVEFPK
jgi:hypothetical protein